MTVPPLAPAAYCGSPPAPAELLWRWNLDPLLLSLLAGVTVAYVVGARRSAGLIGPRRQLAFHGGWSLVTIALVSPVCALAVALFSARVGQHMAIVLIATPLIAWGRPDIAWRGLTRRGGSHHRHDGSLNGLMAAWIAFTAALWAWHLPLPYDASLRSTGLYWLMNVSLLACSWRLWHAHFRTLERNTAGLAALATLATSMQMGVLGALITFSSAPLYASHRTTTLAWGLTALEDQQLGGLLMWVPGGAVLLFAAMHAVSLVLNARAPAPANALGRAGSGSAGYSRRS